MAKLNGLIKIKGTIGDITFYQLQDGSYYARAKSSLNKARIAKDPAFARTRENNNHFARAGKAASLLRAGFRTMITSADSKVHHRLLSTFMKCLNADTTNDRGNLTVQDGNQQLLIGFDFNIHSKLHNTMITDITNHIDRTTGTAEISIPAFVPTQAIKKPKGATHYRLIAGAAELDFANEVVVKDETQTSILPINNTPTLPLTLTVTLTPNSKFPIYQALGICFYQEVNGTKYPLNNETNNATKIINVAP
jgi:hypothetical protein